MKPCKIIMAAAGLLWAAHAFAEQPPPSSRRTAPAQGPCASPARTAFQDDAAPWPDADVARLTDSAPDDAPDGPIEGIPSVAATYASDIRAKSGGNGKARRKTSHQGRSSSGFCERLLRAYADDFRASHVTGTFGQSTGPAPKRRGLPSPFSSPPFPNSEFLNLPPHVGFPYSNPTYPLERALQGTRLGTKGKKANPIHVYGFVDTGGNVSTSRKSNIPQAYDIVPNSVQLDQLILRFERVPDSVQTDERDWGFRFTNLYGIDYRYTTAKGWFSEQLLDHNRLYGYDPLEVYAAVYLPNIGDGTVVRVGRFTSPPDIEAQLATDNYLYSHSLMFTYDPYTFTGVHTQTRVNDQWTFYLGVHAGNDMAPWQPSAQPNGLFMFRWVSKDNKDSVLAGVPSIGTGRYTNGHDNKQMIVGTWTHKFNDKLHTMTEAYYIYQFNALMGGTVVNGPPEPFFPFVGPGPLIPGISDWYGFVNYTNYKFSTKDYVTLRTDFLDDLKGQQTNFKNFYSEFTLGWGHYTSQNMLFRPEIRWDHAYSRPAYDNGTRRNQITIASDVIVKF